MDDKKNQFGIQLKYYLKIKEIMIKDFAEGIGVTPPAVSGWLSGRRQPSLDLVIKAAEFLQVGVQDLLRIQPMTNMEEKQIQIIEEIKKLSSEDLEVVEQLLWAMKKNG